MLNVFANTVKFSACYSYMIPYRKHVVTEKYQNRLKAGGSSQVEGRFDNRRGAKLSSKTASNTAFSRMLDLHSLRKPLLAVAESSEASTSDTGTDLGPVIEQVCDSLGHSSEEAAQLTDMLEKQWFTTLEDLQMGLSQKDALVLGLPLRVHQALMKWASAVPASFQSQEVHLKEDDLVLRPLDVQKYKSTTVTGKKKYPSEYRLRPEETPPDLQEELDAFYRHMTKKFYGQLESEIREATAKPYLAIVRQILGWINLTRQAQDTEKAGGSGAGTTTSPAGHLSLRDIFPDSSSSSAETLFYYLQFLTDEREVSASRKLVVCRTMLKLAKFMFFEEVVQAASQGSGSSLGRRAYDTLPVIISIRAMSNQIKEDNRNAAPVSDVSKKWIDWPQFLACCEVLRRECHPPFITRAGNDASDLSIALRFQRYLILGIFSCVPDRQRTIRELHIGTTLLKQDGNWVIKHSAGDYKTGKSYGDRAPLQIDSSMTPYIDEFIEDWREHFEPVNNHKYLFCTTNGKPATEWVIHSAVSQSIFRMTGQKTNPHLLRDSIVTYVRSQEVTEAQLEALALYMGHSVNMQKVNYDRRTMDQKVAPAVNLLKSIAEGRD